MQLFEQKGLGSLNRNLKSDDTYQTIRLQRRTDEELEL
jgi:hypothetical protein